MECLKNDVDSKFMQVLATSTVQQATIEDLKLMFQSFMGKSKCGDEGSPSIIQSALENEESRGGHKRHVTSLLPNS